MLPGDIEQRRRADRLAHGIELDETTWHQLEQVAQSLGIPAKLLDVASNDQIKV